MVKTIRATDVVANCLAMGDVAVKRGTLLFDWGQRIQSLRIVQLAKMESASRYLAGLVICYPFHKTTRLCYVKRSYYMICFARFVNNHAGLACITYNIKHGYPIFGKCERGGARGSEEETKPEGVKEKNLPSLSISKKYIYMFNVL